VTSITPSRIEQTRDKLRRHGQQHLIQFFDRLSADEQDVLLNEIDSLDLSLIGDLVARYVRTTERIKLPETIEPAPYYRRTPPPEQQEKYQRALQRGRQLISQGKVAAFTVAGGQGTRLNFDGPKGNVAATPVRQKSLFQLFAEGVRATQRRYGCTIFWYIMTSQANHLDTVESFQQNNYFGLDPDQVRHFRQGMMPAFDFEGKILLSAPGRLALSPDGHGGSLRALYKSGALTDMAQRGVEYISYFQIDNPLVYTIDPLFIGLHALDGAEMSSKAVLKAEPLEKVGNFTLADGKITVIEYSDLPEELALRKHENGGLVFELGSIAIHIISRAFVERLNGRGFSLPWHRAVKRIGCIDPQGRAIEPAEPNGIKLETFVFDALPLAAKSIILEIDRSEQFAPIKNATGVDSLESSHQLQIARAARWLEQAGVAVPRKADGSVDGSIEISPLFALDADELQAKRDQLPEIKPGGSIYLD